MLDVYFWMVVYSYHMELKEAGHVDIDKQADAAETGAAAEESKPAEGEAPAE